MGVEIRTVPGRDEVGTEKKRQEGGDRAKKKRGRLVEIKRVTQT